MVAVLRKVNGGFMVPAKLHGTREAINGGRVRVRIIHGLNISQKNSYTYCKNLEVTKNQVLRACS